MKRTIEIEDTDITWLRQELLCQLGQEQRRLPYALPSSVEQLKANIEAQTRILEALGS